MFKFWHERSDTMTEPTTNTNVTLRVYYTQFYASIYNLDETGEFFKLFSLNYKNGPTKKQKTQMHFYLSQN